MAALSSHTTAEVACGACRACCRRELVLVDAEMGDDVDSYDTVEIETPKGAVRALKHQPNGDCIYLGEAGCTIWGRHPHICRIYDCGAQYAMLSRAVRRKRIADGLMSKDRLERGREVWLARQRLQPKGALT